MTWIRELAEWIWAVIKAWYGWVGASATVGLVSFGQGMGWWRSPGRHVYVGLLAAGFIWSVFTAWVKEHRDKLALMSPKMVFVGSYSSAEQISKEGLPVIFQRIGLKNDSPAIAQECELVISKCSINVPGLSMDTPLNIKDVDARKGDINRGATRHFDLFITYHTNRNEWPHGTYIMAPNTPSIPWRESKETAEILLTLTGRNFDSEMWRVKVRLEEGKAEVVEFKPYLRSMPR